MKIKCHCKNCNNVFEAYQHQIDNGRGVYCKLKCYHEYKKNFGLTDEQKKKISDATKLSMKDPKIIQKIINGLSNPEVKKKMSDNGKKQMSKMLDSDVNKMLWSWKISKSTKEKWNKRPLKEKQKILIQINNGRLVFFEKMLGPIYKQKHVKKCLCNGIIKDTKPEKEVKTILELNNIHYIHPYQVKHKVFDFYIPNKNLLIEVDGIYWHGKNLNENQMNNMQKKHKINDVYKNNLAYSLNYNIERIWEDEINEKNVMERISKYE